MENPNPAPDPESPVSNLHVKAHVVMLKPGLFCIYQTFNNPADPTTGLPSVVILPAFDASSNDGVTIKTHSDHQYGTAALVKVSNPDAKIVITVYQRGRDEVPQLRVLRLNADEPTALPDQGPSEMMAHIHKSGDVGYRIGEWVGMKGSWIEGFGLSPEGLGADEIEYQAILGKNWVSPWVEAGLFCGSRGMALPLLGFNVRLKGEAALKYSCSYSATFVDGTEVNDVRHGEPCEAKTLAALETFRIIIEPKVAVDQLSTIPSKQIATVDAVAEPTNAPEPFSVPVPAVVAVTAPPTRNHVRLRRLAILLAVAALCTGLAAWRVRAEWTAYRAERAEYRAELTLRATLMDVQMMELDNRGREIEAQRTALTRCVFP